MKTYEIITSHPTIANLGQTSLHQCKNDDEARTIAKKHAETSGTELLRIICGGVKIPLPRGTAIRRIACHGRDGMKIYTLVTQTLYGYDHTVTRQFHNDDEARSFASDYAVRNCVNILRLIRDGVTIPL